ncbi:MAG: cell division protein SepF [Bifidobacteriaceae bacterium]|nr:cell division protein SepF [Bifidobacteriaceae bacterium]
MSGFMKRTMSYLGMTDVVDDIDDAAQDEVESNTSFDDDNVVASLPQESSSRDKSSASASHNSFASAASRFNRITTISPKTYEDAQMVGRALRDGVPVVLNLSDVPEAISYRIVDFSAGVVFGLKGSIERVTPRVFLLSPSQVRINIQKAQDENAGNGIF